MSTYDVSGGTGRRGRSGRMLRWLPFVSVALEIVVFVAVGRWIGFGWALLLVIATSVAGLIALRLVGLSTWRRLRGQAARPGADVAGIQDALAGVGVRIAGAFLLVLPGLVSSAVGALLLIPPIGRMVSRMFPAAVMAGSMWRTGRGGRGGPDVVQGEVVETDVIEVDVEDVEPPNRSASDFHDAISLDEGRDD